jgi:hypothetical protein
MFSPEQKALSNAKYRTTQKGKEANRKGVKKAVKNNPIYKMSMNVRHRLNEFLNLKRLTKKNKTFEMVGCTPAELKIYLEKKFEPGMTWWNHSPKGWHIDHIIPLSNAKNYEDIVKLMHYPIESILQHVSTTTLYPLSQVKFECTCEIAIPNTHGPTDLYLYCCNKYIQKIVACCTCKRQHFRIGTIYIKQVR